MVWEHTYRLGRPLRGRMRPGRPFGPSLRPGPEIAIAIATQLRRNCETFEIARLSTMVRAQAETRLQSTATAKGRGVRAAEESGNLRSIGQQRPQAVNGLTGKSEMVPWCRCGRNCDEIAIAIAIAIATFEIAILSKFRFLTSTA